jgi:hypothetical protein
VKSRREPGLWLGEVDAPKIGSAGLKCLGWHRLRSHSRGPTRRPQFWSSYRVCLGRTLNWAIQKGETCQHVADLLNAGRVTLYRAPLISWEQANA